ncbi:hypothetical protein ACNAW0_28250 [Micromonospora sp. SL1-18]|uniref:hypothetical protein n=1 Tax=Micromonospora sp. SL1-18 TaxID=3399128 RepID=UPI003A4DA505
MPLLTRRGSPFARWRPSGHGRRKPTLGTRTSRRRGTALGAVDRVAILPEALIADDVATWQSLAFGAESCRAPDAETPVAAWDPTSGSTVCCDSPPTRAAASD